MTNKPYRISFNKIDSPHLDYISVGENHENITFEIKRVYQGLNSRFDEIQAAVLDIKLKQIDSDNQKRRYIAGRCCAEITNTKIIRPQLPKNSHEHVWHLFVIRTSKRDQLQKYLLENGIQNLIHYPIPPHKQKAYKYYNHLSFPVTEKIHEEVLSLPISPVLKQEEVQKVIEVLNKY